MPLLHGQQETTDIQDDNQQADDFSWMDHATFDSGESDCCLCFQTQDQANQALQSVQYVISKTHPGDKEVFVCEHLEENTSQTTFRLVLSDAHWRILADYARSQIRENSKYFEIQGDFVIKTINPKSKTGYDHFMRSLAAPFEKFPLRPSNKKRFTVTGEGVFQREFEEGKEPEAPLKVPQYTQKEKQGFSQVHAFTLATPQAHPKPFSDKHPGVLIPSEHTLLTDRLFDFDGDTDNRPYDSETLEEAEQYSLKEKNSLYSRRRLKSFKEKIEADGHGRYCNEVLARAKWSPYPDSQGNYPCVFIPSDNLSARMGGIEFAKTAEKDLRDQEQFDKDYRIRTFFYIPRNPSLHFKEYSLREQQLDQLELDKLKLGVLSAHEAKLLQDPELRRSLLEGNVDFIETLFKCNIDGINQQDELGDTALIRAVKHGDRELTHVLLKLDADVDITDNDGYTALMYAVLKSEDELVKFLLKYKADPNLQNDAGYTALMYAVINGRKESVRLLVEHKADVNLKNKRCETALICGLCGKNTEEVFIQRIIEYPFLIPDDTTRQEIGLRELIARRIQSLASTQKASCAFFQEQDPQAHAEGEALQVLLNHFDNPAALREDPALKKHEALLNRNRKLRDVLTAHQILVSKRQEQHATSRSRLSLA